MIKIVKSWFDKKIIEKLRDSEVPKPIVTAPEAEDKPNMPGADGEKVEIVTIESLQAEYEAKFGNPPANSYKNNVDWLVKKISE